MKVWIKSDDFNVAEILSKTTIADMMALGFKFVKCDSHSEYELEFIEAPKKKEKKEYINDI